jgi:hypothetical protein
MGYEGVPHSKLRGQVYTLHFIVKCVDPTPPIDVTPSIMVIQ